MKIKYAIPTFALAAFASASTLAQQADEYSCGFALETGTYATWPGGYQAWTRLNNFDNETVTEFTLWLDIGGGSITDSYEAEFASVENGYEVTQPEWLQWQTIAQGDDYTFAFIGEGEYLGVTPYVIAINGETCDTVNPEVSLSTSATLFTSEGTLTLTSIASDNVAVRKVVFEQNGQIIGEDFQAPYELELDIAAADNGRHSFVATAYDPSGNSVSSDTYRVFAAIRNRFLGTAPGSEADFVDADTYFNQITPEDAGKWGSVEATRDEMNWVGLDQAYDFAKSNGFPFKLHTLIWGQQAPSWMDDLSEQEQLAEIEEWMAALANRYPDVDMIDVVNEPLHAPPSFTSALGGEGETGWDWVISSFELARNYFPDAQLLINDYQILILENFSYDYLEVITPLMARGLLDGIGVQAHFLERADTDIVAAALSNLSATGLPIYVSEFDVNIADDAHHANRVRDLFTTFWNNESVVGVTHWGHLEGDIWRENAYLIRTDGTTRPGFDWMLCFYAGGEDCTVPEYVPAGWTGDTNGLFLEAEEYDEGKGLAALGGQVAYVDDGDWIAYEKVNFEDTWDELSFTYLKGNEEVGTVSFHLDSLDAEPVLEVPLEPTGGWGTAATLDVAWPSIAGEYDLYIRFNEVGGVANVDSIYFHPPLAEPGYGLNLVSNPGFEDGTTTGWFTWDGELSTTSESAYDGDYSLLLSNRTGNGPAAFSLLSAVNQDSIYEVRLYASLANIESADINITSKITCDGEDTYSWVVSPTLVTEGDWVELQGQLTVPECDLTDLLIYAEGPPGGVDLLLDEVSVREILVENLIAEGGFENGTTPGWFSWDGTIGTTTTQVYEGNYALELSERTGNGPAAYNLTSLAEPGASYSLSMAVSHIGVTEAALNITLKTECAGEAEYTWVANDGALAEGEWTVLSGTVDVPDCELTDLLIYLEGPEGGVNLYIDEVVFSPL